MSSLPPMALQSPVFWKFDITVGMLLNGYCCKYDLISREFETWNGKRYYNCFHCTKSLYAYLKKTSPLRKSSLCPLKPSVQLLVYHSGMFHSFQILGLGEKTSQRLRKLLRLLVRNLVRLQRVQSTLYFGDLAVNGFVWFHALETMQTNLSSLTQKWGSSLLMPRCPACRWLA